MVSGGTLGWGKFGLVSGELLVGFSPTRLAFGVLTVLIENRIVFCGGGGSPRTEPGSPDDPNLVPPMKNPQKMIPK